MNLSNLRAALLLGAASLWGAAAGAADDGPRPEWLRGSAEIARTRGDADGTVSVQVHTFETMPTSPGSGWIEDPQKNQPGLRMAPDDEIRTRRTPFDDR